MLMYSIGERNRRLSGIPHENLYSKIMLFEQHFASNIGIIKIKYLHSYLHIADIFKFVVGFIKTIDQIYVCSQIM